MIQIGITSLWITYGPWKIRRFSITTPVHETTYSGEENSDCKGRSTAIGKLPYFNLCFNKIDQGTYAAAEYSTVRRKTSFPKCKDFLRFHNKEIQVRYNVVKS
jgi:hypothetical protein